jgi:hypothetical protein
VWKAVLRRYRPRWNSNEIFDAFHDALYKVLQQEHLHSKLDSKQLCVLLIQRTGGALSNKARALKRIQAIEPNLRGIDDDSPAPGDRWEDSIVDRSLLPDSLFAIHHDIVALLARLDFEEVIMLLMIAMGFKARDVATVLGCSVGVVYTRLCRLRSYIATLE